MIKIIFVNGNVRYSGIIPVFVRLNGDSVTIFDHTAPGIVSAHQTVGGEIVALRHPDVQAAADQLARVGRLRIIQGILRGYFFPCISDILRPGGHRYQRGVRDLFITPSVIFVKAPIHGPPVAPLVPTFILIGLFLQRPGIGPLVAGITVLVLFLAAGQCVTSGFERTFVPALGGAFGFVDYLVSPCVIKAPKVVTFALCIVFMEPEPIIMVRIVLLRTLHPLCGVAVVIVLMYTVMAVAAVQRVGVFLLFAGEISPLSVGPYPLCPIRNVFRRLLIGVGRFKRISYLIL